ncbi:hypothetical protein, partial [Moorena sp. SIO3F7]|uniref:hypothetical protein n=1 Tax=Moorena sp. SIO3F7 TaxID=2607839 RepID=UPI0025FA351A
MVTTLQTTIPFVNLFVLSLTTHYHAACASGYALPSSSETKRFGSILAQKPDISISQRPFGWELRLNSSLYGELWNSHSFERLHRSP